MSKNIRYRARLYGEFVDADENVTDLLRRCTERHGLQLVMSEDFKIEKEKEVHPRS